MSTNAENLRFIDLKLINRYEQVGTNPTAVGYYDISVDTTTGDLELEDGFDTSLIVSIFGERRAASYEVSTPRLRRGWWGNTTRTDSHEDGSKLWLLDQARLTTGTVRLSGQYAYEGLKWLIEDGYLKDIETAPAATVSSTGEGSITLEVKLVRHDYSTEKKYLTVWEATGN